MRLLSVKDLVERGPYRSRKWRELIATGTVPSFKVGRKVFVLEADWVAFVLQSPRPVLQREAA